MNVSDKKREERLMTNVANGYLYKLDSFKDLKGLRSRASAIEFLLDEKELTEEEINAKIEELKHQSLVLKEQGDKVSKELELLQKEKETIKLSNQIRNKKKEVFYEKNLPFLLNKLIEGGSSDEEVYSKCIEFAKINQLDSTKCLDIGKRIINNKSSLKRL